MTFEAAQIEGREKERERERRRRNLNSTEPELKLETGEGWVDASLFSTSQVMMAAVKKKGTGMMRETQAGKVYSIVQ